jgi:Flp pilus assembly protein TadG
MRIVMGKSKIRLLSEAGQALVEFALVTLFVILPVTFGIIDGGILFYKWVTLNNGAREGARTGAIYQSSRTSYGSLDDLQLVDGERANVIRAAAERTALPLVTIEDLAVDYPDGDPIVSENPTTVYRVYRGGDRVTVTITHTHAPLVGLVIGLDQIELSAAATMRIERGGVAPTPTPP